MTALQKTLSNLKSQARGTLQVVGGTPLEGIVTVQGGKNAALKIIAALPCFSGRFRLKNIPYIIDTLELLTCVEFLGASVVVEPGGDYVIDTTSLQNKPLPYDMTKATTTSFCFAGALLGRFGELSLGKPGGDEIGARPVDVHLDLLRKAGSTMHEDVYVVTGSFVPVDREVDITMPMQSVGACMNLLHILVASRTKGVVRNAPYDSDIEALLEFFRLNGVAITYSNSTMIIKDYDNTHEEEIVFVCPPDRNESFTWLCAGALSVGGVTVRGIDGKELAPGIEKLREIGVEITQVNANEVFVCRPVAGLSLPANYRVIAGPSPMFHSDWAPLLQVVLCGADGTSTIIDTLFDNRTRQAEILGLMGASIQIKGGTPPQGVRVHFTSPQEKARYITTIIGPHKLHNTQLAVGNDVRACAAIVLAATNAAGSAELSSVYALFRGYESFLDKLRGLGAVVRLLPG
ncbi:MAG: hypothetical protein WBP26_01665 [Candidatus Saccharimonadales bacterium]